jgi:predicted ATPase
MAKDSTLEEVFVGRNRVLEQLKVNFNNPMERRARVVFVVGEAGIGKTIVVNHFLSELLPHPKSEGSQSKPLIFILRASCESGWSGNPYAPFAKLLEGLSKAGQKILENRLKYWARELAPAVIEGVIPFPGPVLAKALKIQLSRQGKRHGVSIPYSQSYQFLQLFEQLRANRKNSWQS